MGPCWVTIRNPRTLSDPASWCAVEVGVESPKLVVKTAGADCPKEVPPLVTMCLSMKTAVNPATSLHEIVALSAMVHSKVRPFPRALVATAVISRPSPRPPFSPASPSAQVDAEGDPDENPRLMRRFTLVRQLGTTCGSAYTPTFPNNLPAEIKRAGAHAAGLQTFPNERALLSMFFVRIQQEDPDVIASHNLYGFEFDVILARAQVGATWVQRHASAAIASFPDASMRPSLPLLRMCPGEQAARVCVEQVGALPAAAGAARQRAARRVHGAPDGGHVQERQGLPARGAHRRCTRKAPGPRPAHPHLPFAPSPVASQTSYSLTSLAASVLKFNRVEVRASHRPFCDRVLTLNVLSPPPCIHLAPALHCAGGPHGRAALLLVRRGHPQDRRALRRRRHARAGARPSPTRTPHIHSHRA